MVERCCPERVTGACVGCVFVEGHGLEGHGQMWWERCFRGSVTGVLKSGRA